MTESDLDEEIDQFALKVERQIVENRETIADLPDFAPRSERSRKLKEAAKADS